MSESSDRDRNVKIIDDAAKMLGEHFDSVRIFATYHNGHEEGTSYIVAGVGNFFASYGLIAQWITEEKEKMKLKVKSDLEDED